MSETPTTVDAAENDTFTLFAVFGLKNSSHGNEMTMDAASDGVHELEECVDTLVGRDVTVRGWYDVSGLRAGADLMVWLHGPVPENLQQAVRELRRTSLLAPLVRVWSALGVHRDAEFNQAHVPGFVRGVAPKAWLTVYPFVRTPEWYLLDPADRGRMLADHGRRGAAFKGVTANTVAAFALGDYEWLLPMEADDPVELVDLLRDLRYTEARHYTKVEVPFFTGRHISPAEIVEVLQ
ncbi:hydrogen peroxide-dependent heme synthase [Propionimicrobium sp. PCR01-08-3]|uniref:hydrogen peroxide-dependent heme synthase n=1 Tax=Propionimicrobium sp. PCR01-08-3 TaxID=3052086 RepID=UPI00255C9902|nr:hydrogen peroxide-dependent heme synthase [Propionimicrobium sp. PCR01-08-3]WIY82924.1 chlorite dismutase family protein [Propionimicrobium sp. PCR01-08-3]